jgi:hypothetical protein
MTALPSRITARTVVLRTSFRLDIDYPSFPSSTAAHRVDMCRNNGIME